MRAVIWTDERGYRRRSFVRDNDGDDMALFGIPANVPDIENIDWEYFKRELHNALVEAGLFTWDDIQNSPTGLMVAQTLVKRTLSGLYQQDAKDRKDKTIKSGG